MNVVVETGNSGIRALSDANRHGLSPHMVVSIDKSIYQREQSLSGEDFSSDYIFFNPDQYWVVGQEVGKLGQVTQTQIGSTRYTASNGGYFKALVYRAIASVFNGLDQNGKVQVEISLCVSHALNDMLYRDHIYEVLVGKKSAEYQKTKKPVTHKFWSGKTEYQITIKELFVFNEVAGGYHSFRIRFKPGSPDSTITYPYAGSSFLIVDTGHGTTQLATFNSDGRLNPNSRSLEYGMYNVLSEYSNALKEYLQREYSVSMRISDSDFVLSSFKSGSVPVVGHGKVDITPVRTRVINNIRNQISRSWANDFNSGVGIDYVVLTSGAAQLLYSFVSDIFDSRYNKNIASDFRYRPLADQADRPSLYVFTASMLSEQYGNLLYKTPSLTNAAGLLSLVYKVQWEAANR